MAESIGFIGRLFCDFGESFHASSGNKEYTYQISNFSDETCQNLEISLDVDEGCHCQEGDQVLILQKIYQILQVQNATTTLVTVKLESSLPEDVTFPLYMKQLPLVKEFTFVIIFILLIFKYFLFLFIKLFLSFYFY